MEYSKKTYRNKLLITHQEKCNYYPELTLINLLIKKINDKKSIKASNYINTAGLHEIIIEEKSCVYNSLTKCNDEYLNIYHFKGNELEYLNLL